MQSEIEMSGASRTTDVAGAALQAMLCPHVHRLLLYLQGHIPPTLRRQIDPHDVVQDTLFEATRAAGRFASDGDPEQVWRWLATIARNRLINLIEASRAAKRGGGTRQLGEDELGHGSVVAMLHELAAHEHTPSRSAARRELVVTLQLSLGRVQPAYRDAIKLRYIDGLSLKETADRLSRTEESTRKLCVRGLRALRVEMRSLSLYF